MNRKNTIVIAILVNAGLLAILLVSALTSHDEPVSARQMLAESAPVPKFEEPPLYRELPVVEVPIVMVEPEPVMHKLPQLTIETPIPAPVATNEVAVKKGDSLDKIAKTHHVSVDEIIKLNHLPSSFLKVGQVLKMPVGKAAPVEVAKGPEYYTMKVGDTPWGVASKHKMKVDELLRLNALNEEKARKLKAGDRLRIR